MGKIPEPANDDIDEAKELAEGERLLQDFNRGMDGVIRSMMRAQDQVIVEGAGLTERPFGDSDLLKLSDALYLPVLGGVWLRNGQRQVSPTFTKASLELAIEKGDLEAIWKHNKWHVTPLAISKWAAQSEPKAKKSSKRSGKSSETFGYKAPSIVDRLDQREGGVAFAAAIEQMDALDAMLKSRKKKKGK